MSLAVLRRFGSLKYNRSYRFTNITGIYTTGAPSRSSYIRFDVMPEDTSDIVLQYAGVDYTFSPWADGVFQCTDTIWSLADDGNTYEITFSDE